MNAITHSADNDGMLSVFEFHQATQFSTGISCQQRYRPLLFPTYATERHVDPSRTGSNRFSIELPVPPPRHQREKKNSKKT
jgi:hypothetical protein